MTRIVELFKRLLKAVTKADRKAARKVRKAELEARRVTDAILGDDDQSAR